MSLTRCRYAKCAMIAMPWCWNYTSRPTISARSSVARDVWRRPCARCCAPEAHAKAAIPRWIFNKRTFVPGQKNDEWATIGQVVALFGIRGELKVRSLTDIPNRFAELDKVFIGEEHTPRTIEHVRPYKGDLVILKLAGLDNANAAELLRNAVVQIPLQALAKL